jgi:hypothetical protein
MYVNNHIHTTYSFSPYSPTQAVEMAVKAGLKTAGIMDHDSISGAREFIAAGRLMSIATTIGIECRVKVTGTRLDGRRINNPDQDSIMYMALHAVPHSRINEVTEFFAPLREKRNVRNRKMVDNINKLLPNVRIDFDTNVLPLSKANEGGSVTERHLMYALAKKILASYEPLSFLKDIGIEVSDKVRGWLTDKDNKYLEYDLLGVLKSSLIPKVYVDADDECAEVTEVIALGKRINAISAYAYLGDVTDSVTGDKLAQTFEDGYLDLLFEEISKLGFNAVTYMPSRNSLEQLIRVRELCDNYGLMQISGEDINSPRQSFICEALTDPIFKNLIDSTWKLVEHEKLHK